jgi:hypothetical protein
MMKHEIHNKAVFNFLFRIAFGAPSVAPCLSEGALFKTLDYHLFEV